MKNFYYVLTYNINHDRVKRLVSGMNSISESMLELKIKSKLYMSYNSAAENVQADFEKKVKQLFSPEETDNQFPVTMNLMMNPSFMIDADPDQPKGNWDESCCCKMYYLETSEDDEEGPDLHAPWMFRYEIHIIDDAIDMNKSTYNNQLLSMNLGLASSTYQ